MREAEVSIADTDIREMGIEELFSLTQEAGLLDLEELACRGKGAVIQVELRTRPREGALDELEYVDEWNHVAQREGAHVYVISFTAPNLPQSLESTAENLLGTCDPEIDERGATMSLVGPHEVISGQLAEYEAAGISPDLQRIGGYDGPEDPLDELTDRQLTALQRAYFGDFFEWPRPTSGDDLAESMGIARSTYHQHLRAAERKLVKAYVDPRSRN